jgi:DNA-binding NarL/FixJ family response regulator
MSKSHVRVLCVDDHRIVRDGLALIINRQADMRVVAFAGSGEQSVELFRRHRPDVTLMDLQLGAMSGVDAIRAIRHEDPEARIVVLTMSQGDEDIHSALDAGAATYLLKDTVADDLVRVIRDVNAGKHLAIPADVKARLEDVTARSRLSPREVQVMQLISEGMRNKEIAVALGISEETVQVHVKKILAKFNVQDRTAAVSVAIRRGIIHLSR